MANRIPERLRAAVAQQANLCCEYCLIHDEDSGFPHQIDHIISRKHGGSSDSDNLAYACMICNRNKGTDIASLSRESGQIVRLFHPRHDSWNDHFELAGSRIVPVTDIGEATIRVLQLNSPERVAERIALRKLGRFPRT